MRYLRRLPYLVVGTVLVVAAFSTGYSFLFYLVYLGLLVVGGSYLVTRNGLADLEAGYAVNQLQAHVGDQLRTTYTLRNTIRSRSGPAIRSGSSRRTRRSGTVSPWSSSRASSRSRAGGSGR